MSTYDQTVKQNLEHMHTPMSEWSACTIKRMVDTGERVMPEFEIPQGYKPAPSLFRNTNTIGDLGTCELCGHTIKFFYWVQNDSQKLVMAVGSECINHFEGKSGEQIAKEVVWEANRQLLRDAIDTKRSFWHKYSRNVHIGYGRYEQRLNLPVSITKAYYRLSKLVEGRQPDANSFCHATPDSNGTISGWVKRNGEEVKQLMQTLSGVMNS